MNPPRFDTQRFIVAPLAPQELRQLAQVLLADEQLAARVPWMREKNADGVAQEAFLLALQCTAGTTQAWGIVERTRSMLIGAVLARQSVAGFDLEVLCAPAFWHQGVADEAAAPVAEWLADAADAEIEAFH
jgi:RimJ/RimL family protein N-acetyltransferase